MYPEKGPRGRLVCLCVVCPLVYPEKGPRGRLVCLYVVCPLVYPENGPRGRLVCLCVVYPLVYPEKGPKRSLVCLYSLLSQYTMISFTSGLTTPGRYFMYRSLEYVIFIYIRVKDIVYNTVLRVKDSVVHRSCQQSLVAKWLGLCVHS